MMIETSRNIYVTINMHDAFDVGFSYCSIDLEVLKYSLEQYIGFVGRLAFIHYCGLHQV